MKRLQRGILLFAGIQNQCVVVLKTEGLIESDLEGRCHGRSGFTGGFDDLLSIRRQFTLFLNGLQSNMKDMGGTKRLPQMMPVAKIFADDFDSPGRLGIWQDGEKVIIKDRGMHGGQNTAPSAEAEQAMNHSSSSGDGECSKTLLAIS